ncbi:hypothetical protein U9M48_002512, partial [Paspalum notatum var. saurae]
MAPTRPDDWPSWLPDGMDPKTSFNLEFRIFATKSRFPWFLHTEVVDSDTIKYKDLLDEIMRKYPCSYGEVVKMYYYCAESKSNIEVQGNADQEDDSDLDSNSESNGSDDEMVEDNVPPHIAEVVYDKADPPMKVGSIYPNMNAFRLALASHAIKNEFEFDIEKSEPGRYRVYCCGRIEGYKWRIHASTMGETVKVKKNPHLHECHSTRRKGQVKGATKHWVADTVRDWLVDNPRLTPKALQQRIKDEFKVWVHYKRVYHDSETSENWSWLMGKLKEAIGTPLGLTISTDCGQVVMGAVSEVFPTAEHRECMWHLVQNFKK